MRVQIIGAGVVGQATGMGLSAMGHDVVFVDVNKDTLSSIQRRGYSVSSMVMKEQDATLISVPTPTKRGKVVLDYIGTVANSIGDVLQSDTYQVVVMRSTVPPGTVDDVVLPILEDASGLTVGKDFGLCMNPEFLVEGNANEDFLNATSFIVGEHDEASGAAMETMFGPWNVPVIHMPIKAAELVKYASNVFGALKITYFNIIGKVAEGLDIDPHKLVETIADHSHILQTPRYGIRPGRPYGGACFPKDTMAFIDFLRSNGTSGYAGLFEEMHRTNCKIAADCGILIPEYIEG